MHLWMVLWSAGSKDVCTHLARTTVHTNTDALSSCSLKRLLGHHQYGHQVVDDPHLGWVEQSSLRFQHNTQNGAQFELRSYLWNFSYSILRADLSIGKMKLQRVEPWKRKTCYKAYIG